MFKSIVARMPILYAINTNASRVESQFTVALAAKTLSAQYKVKSQDGLHKKKQIKQIFAAFLHAAFKKILSRSQRIEGEWINHADTASSLSQRNVRTWE